MTTPASQPASPLPYWLGGIIGCGGWLAMFGLDSHLDINNLGMVLVLTSTLVAVCLPWRLAVAFSFGSVLAFDWFFIPPRGTFTVAVHQQFLMLFVMLAVNFIIVSLMAIQRTQSERTQRHAREADILRQWSDTLLVAATPYDYLQPLQSLLQSLSERDLTVMVLKQGLPAQDDMQQVVLLGEAGIEQRHALWYCLRQNQALGKGTGRYELFTDVYLPIRARNHALGAVLFKNFSEHEWSTRIHLQAICDQYGSALERYQLHQQEIHNREQAQSQLVRNTLLAAISHDYRTPLATIMGAASSLFEQNTKLDEHQQKLLAHRIYDEADRLKIITGNVLQLARLDAHAPVSCDWNSMEEILGELTRRWRERQVIQRIHIKQVSPLPLLWCDAVLLAQLIENLVDNALKYSPENSPVTVQAGIFEQQLLLQVIDQGDAIMPAWRERIFEPFQRGMTEIGKPGAGVGLALCRAIARAHSGELVLDCPSAGGNCFSLCIPLRALPDEPLREVLNTP